MAEGQSKSIRGGYLNPRQAKDGSWYLEGNLGGFTVRVYENKYKRSDKDPSHVWYLSEKPKAARQAQGGQGFKPQQQASMYPGAPAPESKPAYKDHTQPAFDPADPGPDEIPF